jgi:hypothetical protein
LKTENVKDDILVVKDNSGVSSKGEFHGQADQLEK